MQLQVEIYFIVMRNNFIMNRDKEQESFLNYELHIDIVTPKNKGV